MTSQVFLVEYKKEYHWREQYPIIQKSFFFDEPTTGLDPIITSVVSDLIMKCQQNLKSTNIVVTHEMKLAREIGDTNNLFIKR